MTKRGLGVPEKFLEHHLISLNAIYYYGIANFDLANVTPDDDASFQHSYGDDTVMMMVMMFQCQDGQVGDGGPQIREPSWGIVIGMK